MICRDFATTGTHSCVHVFLCSFPFQAAQDLRGVKTLMKLRSNKTHIKTYRPNYLVFSGDPSSRWCNVIPNLTLLRHSIISLFISRFFLRTHHTGRMPLVHFMDTLSHGAGATIYGDVVVGDFDANLGSKGR
jgi:hypothetical protein